MLQLEARYHTRHHWRNRKLTVAEIGEAITESRGPSDLWLRQDTRQSLRRVRVILRRGAHRNPSWRGGVCHRSCGGVGEFLVLRWVWRMHDEWSWVGGINSILFLDKKNWYLVYLNRFGVGACYHMLHMWREVEYTRWRLTSQRWMVNTHTCLIILRVFASTHVAFSF